MGATVKEGTVAAFDERRGLGEIEAGDGTRFPFHCTRIADGTRRIALGAAVRFVVVPGLVGRWEAVQIEKLGPEIRAGRPGS